MGVHMYRVTLTRKELYEQVWETPMIKLAKQYCMSDQALRKICKKNDIPIPSVKYRSRKFSGHKVSQTPLLGDPGITISILVRDEAQEIQQKIAKTNPDVMVFNVPAELHSFHGVTRQIKQKMKDKHAYTEGAFRFKQMCLSKENWDRGIRIFDTLIKCLEKNFGRVEIDNNGAFIKLKRSCLHVYINEKIEKIDSTPPPTPEQKKKMEADPYWAKWYYPHTYEYKPTNMMTLMITGGGSYEIAARRNFKDNTKQVLEDQIKDILIAIIRLADIEETELIKREYERLKREREDRVRKQKQQKIQECYKELEALENDVKQWQRAEQIREFVKAKVRYGLANPDKINSYTELRQWVKRSYAYADALDPVLKIKCDKSL